MVFFRPRRSKGAEIKTTESLWLEYSMIVCEKGDMASLQKYMKLQGKKM